MMLIPTPELIADGNEKAIARAISWVENNHPNALELLKQLNGSSDVIGLTGPPGAGKSSLVHALAKFWSKQNLRIAIVAVDPSSVFNFGSLLGDRLRMQSLFLMPNVFIRSISSRGSLGGLSGSIIEVVDVLKHAKFDKIIIETVGVGQSEVEIAGLADTTIVVSVPESGDEIQTLKSGIMEIADIFVVNKSDRDGAEAFASHLQKLAHFRSTPDWETEVILTNAMKETGISDLSEAISKHAEHNKGNNRMNFLLAERAYTLIQKNRMKSVSVVALKNEIELLRNADNFNLYSFIQSKLEN